MRAWLLVSMSLLFANSASALTPINSSEFRACVDQNASTVFSDAMKKDPILTLYGYHDNLDRQLIDKCIPSGSVWPSQPDLAYVDAAIEAEVTIAAKQKEAEDVAQLEKQAVIDAEQEKVEEVEMGKVKSAYYKCLVSHARALAHASAETAPVISEAATASCPNEREAAAETFHRLFKFDSTDFIQGLDASFQKQLILEIIKERAATPKPKRAPSHPSNI